MLDGHGADIHSYTTITSDFSSNVSCSSYSSVIEEILAQHSHEVACYPDVHYSALSTAVAQVHECDATEVLITNGAVSAIYQVAHAFAGSITLLLYPEFAEYESACSMHNHRLHFAPWGEAMIVDDSIELVIIGNPTNPTGALLSRAIIESYLEGHPRTTFVIDESYMDFTETSHSVVSLISCYTNLVVIKSLTKRYAIPGLRVGYLIAGTSCMTRIKRYTQPWSVNALAAAIGEEILRERDRFPLDVSALLREKKRVVDALVRIPQIDITPSACHYFLLFAADTCASELKEYCALQHGILIRDASNFRGLSAHHIRLAVRTPRENSALIQAFYSYYGVSQ